MKVGPPAKLWLFSNTRQTPRIPIWLLSGTGIGRGRRTIESLRSGGSWLPRAADAVHINQFRLNHADPALALHDCPLVSGIIAISTVKRSAVRPARLDSGNQCQTADRAPLHDPRTYVGESSRMPLKRYHAVLSERRVPRLSGIIRHYMRHQGVEALRHQGVQGEG